MAKLNNEQAKVIKEEIKNNLYEIIDEVNHFGFNSITEEWKGSSFEERYGSWSFFSKEVLPYVWSKKDKQLIVKDEKGDNKRMIEDSEKKIFLEQNKYNYEYKTLQVDGAVWERYSNLIKNTNQSKAYINSKMFEKFCDWLEIN